VASAREGTGRRCRRSIAAGLALAATLLAPLGVPAHRAENRPAAVRPAMDFTPPPAGSYTLNVIELAPEGRVVDVDGRARRLSQYTRGSITLLSLIYTYCTDPIGCPLAYEVSVALRDRILSDPRLHGRARFVSLSFDPVNDSPEAMRAYAGTNQRADGPLPWHFLTSRSLKELRPILDGFGQEIEVEADPLGRPIRTISHMLKLFLIDRAGRVREIYSTAFLHPETMLNDIRTLVMEEDGRHP
jgi:cytochrome oxidase Cu insertion factor (SCO1/SenC/PrrC family)